MRDVTLFAMAGIHCPVSVRLLVSLTLEQARHRIKGTRQHAQPYSALRKSMCRRTRACRVRPAQQMHGTTTRQKVILCVVQHSVRRTNMCRQTRAWRVRPAQQMQRTTTRQRVILRVLPYFAMRKSMCRRTRVCHVRPAQKMQPMTTRQ